MYHSIANRLKVKLTDIPCIGDSKRDLEAAMAVNARPILVRSGKGRLTEAGLEEKNGKRYLNGTVIPCFNNLADAVNNLLADQQAVNREPAAKAKS
jgi:D-glycero-D-manno-heptose 1,7-bisphosphate phosphatase